MAGPEEQLRAQEPQGSDGVQRWSCRRIFHERERLMRTAGRQIPGGGEDVIDVHRVPGSHTVTHPLPRRVRDPRPAAVERLAIGTRKPPQGSTCQRRQRRQDTTCRELHGPLGHRIEHRVRVEAERGQLLESRRCIVGRERRQEFSMGLRHLIGHRRVVRRTRDIGNGRTSETPAASQDPQDPLRDAWHST